MRYDELTVARQTHVELYFIGTERECCGKGRQSVFAYCEKDKEITGKESGKDCVKNWKEI